MAKHVEITQIKISKQDCEVIDEMRYPHETRRNFMSRLLKDYEKRGVPREIVRIIADLQYISTKYIHEDLHGSLELVKAVLLSAHSEGNVLKRAEFAQKLTTACEGILGTPKKEEKKE